MQYLRPESHASRQIAQINPQTQPAPPPIENNSSQHDDDPKGEILISLTESEFVVVN